MILSFPSDRIVGTLWWPEAPQPRVGPILATGDLEVPDDAAVDFELSPIARVVPLGGDSYELEHDPRPLDLGFLRRLPPGAVVALTLSPGELSDFAALAHLAPGLRHLTLPFTGLDDAAVATIAALTGLTWLQTFGNRFTDLGVQRLSALRRLENLYLEEATLTMDAFAFVDGLPDLQRLGVLDVALDDEDLAALRTRLPGVEVG